MLTYYYVIYIFIHKGDPNNSANTYTAHREIEFNYENFETGDGINYHHFYTLMSATNVFPFH